MQPPSPSRPRVIAHRGASLEMPENTLKAYQRAIALGADLVEIDVHVTRDGVVVCHHDEALHGESLCIAEHSLKELRAVFPELPTLQDVLKLSFGKTGLMVELKEGKLPLVPAVLEQVQGVISPSLVLGSFSFDILGALKPYWPLSQLIGIVEEEEELAAHLSLSPRYLAIARELATEKQIQRLRAHGIEIWVWTVDDPVVANVLWESGVQGIITNDPRSLLAFYQYKN